MHDRDVCSALVDQRGIALPLALILLTLLISLTLAFLGLTATEPTIAANLKRGEEALTVAEAGIERGIWALANPTVTNLTSPLPDPLPDPYGGAQLVPFGGAGRAYAVTVANSPLPGAGPNDRLITAHGYVVREGVAVPAQPAGLAPADIAAHRVVRLQVSATGPVGGPGAGQNGSDVKLPGALTVAGSLQMQGNSLVDGNHSSDGVLNDCPHKAGVTIRDRTQPPTGPEIDNTIDVSGSASTVGTPAQQELNYDDYAPYAFDAAQLEALKALAQSQGTYIKPDSNSQMTLTVVDGLMFVDTVNGEALGTPPDGSKLANVKITSANNSGWLIVMGSIRIDGNVTYNGFVYAHNDLSYKGTGTGGIFGGVLTGNVITTVATRVGPEPEDSDSSGNSKIYFDCNKIANGGGAFNSSLQDGLNRTIVTVTKGTWRELSIP